MTRKEAFDFYNELVKTGKIEEFRRKHPWEMTKKEQDLFYYDDKKYMYDPFGGEMSEKLPSKIPPGHLTYEKLEALGLLKGMKSKSWSEMTEDERKLFSRDEEEDWDDD